MFWKSVEAGGSPDEYRAYLERYPGGSFAALAEARLQAPPAAAEVEPDLTVELAFWDAVKDAEDPALFAAYIEKFPQGEFLAIAEIKLKALG